MLDERITIKLLFAFACAGIWPVPARPQASTYPTVGNVFFVPEENKDFADIIGSPDCPFINEVLAAGGVVLEQFYGNTHPSIGNYEKVFGGVIETNDDDDTPASFGSSPRTPKSIRSMLCCM
jgi:hypothetical protein